MACDINGRRYQTWFVLLMSSVSFQGLAAFLKAIGYLIPLMDAEYANYYTREVMLILIREFQSPDEEMKKIVLKVTRRALDPWFMSSCKLIIDLN